MMVVGKHGDDDSDGEGDVDSDGDVGLLVMLFMVVVVMMMLISSGDGCLGGGSGSDLLFLQRFADLDIWPRHAISTPTGDIATFAIFDTRIITTITTTTTTSLPPSCLEVEWVNILIENPFSG